MALKSDIPSIFFCLTISAIFSNNTALFTIKGMVCMHNSSILLLLWMIFTVFRPKASSEC